MREQIELAVRRVLRTVGTIEDARQAILGVLPNVSVRGLSIGMTPETRYATVIGQTPHGACRAVVNVGRHDWQ